MRTSLIALTMALLTPISVMAQSTDDASDDASNSSSAAIAIEDQLSLGEDASLPQVGETYTRETNGAWELRCVKAEDEANEPCQMYQLMADAENTPVAEVSIFRLPDGGRAVAGATIIVPLETSLQAQLTLQVDGGQARRYPFAFCNPIGCYSRIGLVADEVNQLRRGANAKVTIVPAVAPDQKVELDMSLSGFTASYDKTSVAQF